MHLLQVIVLSLLQGVSELFPVSSLGHAVILPKLLRWSINETGSTWLAFLVALHLGTATALVIYFWADWKTVVLAFVRSVQKGEIGKDDDQRLAWMVLLGTIPAGVVGSVLESPLKSLFGKPLLAASFMIVNGVIMFVGERLLLRQNAAAGGAPSAGQRDDLMETRLEGVASGRGMPAPAKVTFLPASHLKIGAQTDRYWRIHQQYATEPVSQNRRVTLSLTSNAKGVASEAGAPAAHDLAQVGNQVLVVVGPGATQFATLAPAVWKASKVSDPNPPAPPPAPVTDDQSDAITRGYEALKDFIRDWVLVGASKPRDPLKY